MKFTFTTTKLSINFAKLHFFLHFLPQRSNIFTQIYLWHFATLHRDILTKGIYFSVWGNAQKKKDRNIETYKDTKIKRNKGTKEQRSKGENCLRGSLVTILVLHANIIIRKKVSGWVNVNSLGEGRKGCQDGVCWIAGFQLNMSQHLPLSFRSVKPKVFDGRSIILILVGLIWVGWWWRCGLHCTHVANAAS